MEASEHAISKIEQFLLDKVHFWYPGTTIDLEKIAEYHYLSDHFKRDLLCTRYLLNEVALRISVEKVPNGLKVGVSKKLPREDGKTFLDILSANSTVKNLSAISMFVMPGDPIDYEAELCTDRFKKRVQITVVDHEMETMLIQKSPNEMYVPLPQELFNEVTSVLRLAMTYYTAGIPLDLRTSEKASESTVVMTSAREISTVNVDCAQGDDSVFSWWECTFRDQCTTMAPLSRQEAFSILTASNLSAPPDAVLIGYAPSFPDEMPQCYIMRYIHAIPDNTSAFIEDENICSSVFPEVYHHPGQIIVEGDYCVFYLDPVNRRVVGESRKWHTINDIQFNPSKCNPPDICTDALRPPPESDASREIQDDS